MSSQTLAAIEREPIPPGTLDMLILKTLVRSGTERLHGFEIADAIQQRSRSVLQVEEGSLYPALQRMLKAGWLESEMGVSARNRPVRVFRLTAAGEKRLEQETSSFERMFAGIQRVLSTAKA